MGKCILSQKFWISHVTKAFNCKEMQQRKMRNYVSPPFCEAVAGEGRSGIILPLAVMHSHQLFINCTNNWEKNPNFPGKKNHALY